MAKVVQRPLIFISHITEEREIATALKAMLDASFVGMMDVFVSSDPKSIHLGAQWLEKISAALNGDRWVSPVGWVDQRETQLRRPSTITRTAPVAFTYHAGFRGLNPA